MVKVCAVNLATLERKVYESITRAAQHCGMSKEQVAKCYHQDQQWNGWYFCSPDQVEAKAERIRYLSTKWKKEGMPIRTRATKPKNELVSLVITEHPRTVIMVPPEKATEDYAEAYLQKLNKKIEKRPNSKL